MVFFLVVLIIDFADDLFQNILQRHDTARSAELIHNDGNMHFVLLELSQEVVNLLCLRDKIRRTNQALPPEIHRFGQMRQQVFDIKDSADIILVVLIDRYP